MTLLSFSLEVPGLGLMCGICLWLLECVSNPSPASLEDLIFYLMLLGPFPLFRVC